MTLLENTPRVTRNLVIINAIIFLATLLSRNFMVSAFGLFYPTSPHFHWWQVVTHMFMHGNFWHILFNMYTLWVFGSVVERMIGEKKFLYLYFICGLGAAALQMGTQYLEMQSFMNGAALGNQTAIQSISALKNTPTVGASGAIYGILISYAMLFPQSRMTLIFPPVTLSAKWMVIVFAVIELFTGINGVADGIAHFAHIGGMLFGFLMIRYWRNKGNLFDRQNLR